MCSVIRVVRLALQQIWICSEQKWNSMTYRKSQGMDLQNICRPARLKYSFPLLLEIILPAT
jgi:hypothetical protein